MMMIINGENFHANPTVHIPPWDDPTDHSPHSDHPFIFDELEMPPYDDVSEYDDVHVPLDAFTCDHFRMYEFKIRRCARARSHDWTECPYAHPGEKARRRDPRKFHYSGNPCPEFRKGMCCKGDTCEFAHGVFECWLHPSRYRTQPCKDGVLCRRRICFFAHTPEQLRVLVNGLTQPDSYDGSPSRLGFDSVIGKSAFGSSPTSTLYPSTSSPPMSPVSSIGQTSVNELASSVRNMQIGNRMSPMSGMSGPGFGSPRSLSTLRPGYTSLPSTPTTRNPTRSGGNIFDLWENNNITREEPVMERVESGKEIRAKIYAKLSRENSLVGRVESSPHDGWVSELVN
ncbi:putative transcription factor C3H family [Helianthus debilis subsp. tardiflorus]